MRQTEVSREFYIVLRHNDFKPSCWLFNLHQFQYLLIVVLNVRSQRERTNINHIHIWVFQAKDSGDLRVLFLFEFLNRHPLPFRDRKGVDVNFNTLVLLNMRPRLLEFFLHLAPYSNTIGPELLQFLLGLIFQLPKSVSLLNFRGFDHQELELFEVRKRFVISPSLLNHNSRHDWTTRSLKHLLGILDNS